MSGYQGPGIPVLIEHLATMTGEQVYLWLSPQAFDGIRWRVWTGAPLVAVGGELGRGATPYAALQSAFENLVRMIFDRDPAEPVPA